MAKLKNVVREVFMHKSWYLARCRRCGQNVVHFSRGIPLHAHRYSKKCRNAAATPDRIALQGDGCIEGHD